MPGSRETLHGSAPDSCPVALLLVDVINPLDFPEGDRLLGFAAPAADRLADLKHRARRGVERRRGPHAALALMRRVLKATTPAAAETDFRELLGQ
jgi:hypothetical protein